MKTKKQNILILSGGGTKGLAHIVVLDKIQKETNENISDIFSSIYASSIGAIISTVFIENKDKQFNFLEKFQNITSDIFSNKFLY